MIWFKMQMGYKLTEKVSLLTDYAVKDFNAQMVFIC